MQKNGLLQCTSLTAACVVLAAIYFSEKILGRNLMSLMPVDINVVAQSVGFAAILLMFMYIFITYDIYIVPDIVASLARYKSLILELSIVDQIYLSLLAGISEEMLFRGLFQPAIGIAMSSILFGLAHFLTRGYFIVASGLGFYLGITLQYSNNLLVPIIVHSLYDIFAFRMLISKFKEISPNQAL